MMEKLPVAPDIEEAVLGALLVDNKSALEIMPMVKTSEMFSQVSYRAVFEGIKALYAENEPIDILTLSQKLKALNKLEAAGGEFGIIELTKKISSSAHSEHHCLILQKYWLRRKMIDKCNILMRSAFDNKIDSSELIAIDGKLSDEITDLLFSDKRESTYAEALVRVKQRVELLSNQKEGEFTGVPTGFAKINRFTGGWQPGNLIIVAARPGMGKTAFILKNLVECGLQKVPAGMFSLEMNIDELTARTIAINSNFHLAQITRDGFNKDSYFRTLNERTEEMSKFPIVINDTPGLDIRDLMTKARLWKRKHDIKILFVDYIQLATDRTKSNKSNREQEISSISRNLKVIAKELEIPVIALSQLSREVEKRPDKRPRLSDLRESGAIEQDADIVTFLYRPEYYDSDVPDYLLEQGANAEISFGKYRHGSLATLGIHFDENKAKYSDPEENYNEWQDVDIPKPNADEVPY